ncbi:DUF6790 family protein [Propionicimonas sp.]|uniref:DUF6790 family protein n=1 Tax=Propionicimonas sp. TaxID=1955623 RepID=UPI0039E68BA9
MAYVIGVLLQTVVLPVASGTIEWALRGGDPIEVYGRWWVFWGVGTRLVVAGVVQLVRPEITAGILGSAAPLPAQRQLTRELATANLGMGLAGLFAVVPAWAAPAGAAGGMFLLAAGLMHLTTRGKNSREILATWTDLLVGVVALVLVARFLVPALRGSL